MPTPRDDELGRMDGWPGGVNNRIRETESSVERDGQRLPTSQFLRRALNVDLTAEGHPLRRRGYAPVAGFDAEICHSLWSDPKMGVMGFVYDGQMHIGSSPADIWYTRDVKRYMPMSYCTLNGGVYFSNGDIMGCYDTTYSAGRPWGIPVAPVAGAFPGSALADDAGREQVRYFSSAYVDYYGVLGGASETVPVDQEAPLAWVVSPFPPGVQAVKVFASQINSEILYEVAEFTAPGLKSIQPDVEGKGLELDTLNLKPPQPGQLVRSYRGRIYIARDNVITFTEALRPHLTRPSQGIYMFPENVTMLEPAEDGLYVGHKRGVVFIAGTDPYDVQQVHVSPYAPVPGAVSQIPGEKLGVELDSLPVWWGSDGAMVVGLPGGKLRQLTRDRLAVQSFSAGAVSLREREGMSHIVSTLRDGDGMNNMSASDTVVAEVRRNDIILNN